MIDDVVVNAVALWLAVYALHSSGIYGAVWLWDRSLRGPSPALRTTVWRAATFAAVLTATLQLSGVAEPVTVTVPVHDLAAAAPAVVMEVVAQRASAVAAPAALPEIDPVRLALGLWLAGVTVFALRLVVIATAARRQLADRQPIVDGALFERIQTLAREVGLRRLPQVSVSARIVGPLTLPNGEICIPTWAYERVPRPQLDAMLAHEMAHVLRRDAFWLTAGLVVQAVLFFQPLHMLARRRTAFLAELAADDWAAAHAGSGRALAECLGAFAALMKDKRDPIFAAAMAGRESSLVQRVKRLVDEALPKYRAASGLARGLIWAGVAALAFVLPGLTVGNAMLRSGTTNVSHADNGSVSINSSISTREYRLTVTGEGHIVLAPDGSGVRELSDGAFIDIGLERGGHRQRVRFAGAGGAIERAYWDGAASVPWGAAAETFVAEAMPVVFRETGLNVDERVAYLAGNGVDIFLAEAGAVSSDRIQQRYVEAYAALGPIPPAAFPRLMTMASTQIDSDSGLAGTLATVFKAQKPEGNALALLIAAAASVESDGESRRFLETVSRAPDMNDAAVSAYLAKAASIGSDSEMHGVLAVLLARKDVRAVRAEQALELAAKELESDSEMAELLIGAAPRLPKDENVRAAARKALATIDSDSLHKDVAAALN